MTFSASPRNDSPPAIRRRSRADRTADPLSFQSLRSLAIEQVQAASGGLWTDFNLHDPGVTLLEAICFAMTALVYRADADIADLLCGPDGAIDFERQALFLPQDIYPCRPTTAADYRRLLLDRARVGGSACLSDVHWRSQPLIEGALSGLHSARLLMSAASPETFDQCVKRVHDIYRMNRSLGEDLDLEIGKIEVRFYQLSLEISVEGVRDPVDVLVEIYDVCAANIGPRIPIRPLDTLLREGRSLADIFDGPVMKTGFIDANDLPIEPVGPAGADGTTQHLSLTDLRARLLEIEGVVAISTLSLQRGDEPSLAGALDWNGEVWAPRVCVPSMDASASYGPPADLSRIRLLRRAAPLPIDATAVVARFKDVRAGRRTDRRLPQDPSARIEPPRGAPLPVQTYYSLQNHLPGLYKLGLGGPPPDSPAGTTPAVQQLKAYLSLFDQVLANMGAQRDHLRDLFTADVDAERSYWRDVLTDQAVPGLQALMDSRSPQQIEQQVFARFDDALERRGRVLDYLLALYGETLSQNTSRQFLDYLDSAEQAQLLFENKATFLKEIVALTRDRASGFDYAETLWGRPQRTPPFQQRLCLLLGFKYTDARRLADPTAIDAPGHAWRWTSDEEADLHPAAAAGVPLQWPDRRELPVDDAQASELLKPSRLPLGLLLQSGLDRRRYQWRSGNGAAGRLALVRPEDGRWLDLGEFQNQGDATRLADWLRRRSLGFNDACEGVHVVEHILLRPRSAPVVRDWHSLQLTFVFPNWTARTARAEFRNFAEETIRINCPAHLAPRCIWLSRPAMRDFERTFGHWMAVMRELCAGRAAEASLDEAASRLMQHLGLVAEPGDADA